MSEVKAVPAINQQEWKPPTLISGESDLRLLNEPIGSSFSAVIIYRGHRVFAILEDQKMHWRFPGGKNDGKDDVKGVLSALALPRTTGIANYQDVTNLLRVTSNREIFEETGNTIKPERLGFVAAFLGDDEKVKGAYHLQIFLKYRLKDDEEWIVSPKQPSEEEEKIVETRWIDVIYSKNPKNPDGPGFITLEPFTKMSPAHFRALLQFARNR